MQRYVALLVVAMTVLAGCGNSEGDGEDTATTEAAVTTTSTTAGSSPVPVAVAKDGDVVAVHYVGTLDDGSEFDSSRGRDPLEFEVGTDQVIAGFDAAVVGMAIGETKTVRIPAEEAYGPVDQELIFPVPIDEAPEDVAVGDEVLIDGVIYGRVTGVSATEVVIDTNRRFAGQALTFEIELVTING